MREIKKQKVKKSFLLRFAIFVFAVYMVWGLVNQQIKINEKRRQLSEIKQQIQVQEIKNGEIKSALTSDGDNSEYIERKAREDLGYAKPGERVFINIAGK
ncbi:MAG TPA: septum formation initiator [Ruminococcaceae bacterium]|nr:septum formation initiator [Oscillospiraceae bacterium]